MMVVRVCVIGCAIGVLVQTVLLIGHWVGAW